MDIYESRIRTLAQRNRRLEEQLLNSPGPGQLNHLRELLQSNQRVLDAAIKRNEILKMRLDEAQQELKKARRAANSRAKTQEGQAPSATTS